MPNKYVVGGLSVAYPRHPLPHVPHLVGGDRLQGSVDDVWVGSLPSVHDSPDPGKRRRGLEKWLYLTTHHCTVPVHQSIIQSINQSINQPTNELTNQSINRSQSRPERTWERTRRMIPPHYLPLHHTCTCTSINQSIYLSSNFSMPIHQVQI